MPDRSRPADREIRLPIQPILERTASAEAVEAALEAAGYAIVERLAEPALMDRLDAELGPHIDAVQLGRTDFAGYKTKRVNNLLAKSRAAGELAVHPLVLAVCDRVLLPHCVRYHLHVTGIIELQPGERAQGLHRDGAIYPVRLPSIPMTLATFWACNDFTAENGGTSLVPGSHRWPHDREARPEEVVSAVMPRGSVLFYTSNLIHGGGTNRANVTRRGMALHYNLGWLRQEENQFLSLPPERARELPEALQRLIGYDFGGPYLGFVESGHPQTLLRESLPADMARTSPEADARARALKPLVISES
jgi:ectoine hydroxylase-related dioxygenase (phytanoyl-CoA dioxygenase family)